MNDRGDHIFRGWIKHFSKKPGGLAVDWFKDDDIKNLYFISHAHSDHIPGLLTRNFCKLLKSRPHAIIYCTDITKEIILRLPRVEQAFKEEFEKHYHCLPLNGTTDPTVIVICDENGNPTLDKMSVRTIPANHIPGAVMFLFEDDEKRVLYTGDFRYRYDHDVREENDEIENDEIENDEMRVLKKFVESCEEIDYLYVDVTCLDIGKLYHPEQNKLPTRQESKDMVRELIEKSKPKSVHIDAELVGAEDMVKAIAEFSNNTADEILSRLETSCQRRELYEYTLKDIKIPTAGTTCETDLHIFDKAIFDADCGKCEKDVTLRIRATLKWLFGKPSKKYEYSDSGRSTWRNKREDRDYWQVLYSHHSSDFEVREFFSHLKFKEVFPINEPCHRNWEGIYIKSDPETSSEKKHRHIRKSLYFSLESSSLKCNYKASNVLWLTGDNRDRRVNLSDDKFQVTVRYFRNYENILSEVNNYNQPIDFIIISCTIELQRSLGKLYCYLFRFIDTLKEEIARRTSTIDNAVLFYSTTNNMNDKWKQIINSSRLYRDKKVPKVFYIDLTKIPEYTESNNIKASDIIFETLKNFIRNEGKEVFVSDWPMPYKFSERKREYDIAQERQREPQSQEVDMVDNEENDNDTDDAEGSFVQSDEPQNQDSEIVELRSCDRVRLYQQL